MTDNTEIYYAEMEAARNSAIDAYFEVRPHMLRTIEREQLFKAGFERAFALLFHGGRATQETRSEPTAEGALMELRGRLGLETRVERHKRECSVNAGSVSCDCGEDDRLNALNRGESP